MSRLVPISFEKILQSRSYTVIILGTEEKKFAIYTEPKVGNYIQLYLTQKTHARPFTHEFLHSLLKGLGVKIQHIVISDIEDTVYFAKILLKQQIGDKKQILEIDARPSDCILLSLLNAIPLFCKHEVLEKTIPIPDLNT